MYELRIKNRAEKERFISLAKQRMEERFLTEKKLAALIGRSPGAVYSFFSHHQKPQRFLAAEIATALKMKPEEWRS